MDHVEREERVAKKNNNSMNLQLSSRLTDETVKRRYIESFFEGISPIVLFNHRSFSPCMYDSPITKGLRLQKNAILASSTRALGAPPTIYKSFENTAIRLASDTYNDFTYDSALGFYFLSFHLWGEDTILSNHYRDIGSSIIHFAKENTSNIRDRDKLVQLEIVSLAVERVDLVQFDESMNVLQRISQHEKRTCEIIQQITGFGMFHVLMDKHLLTYSTDKDDTTGPFQTITEEKLRMILFMIERVLEVFFNAHGETGWGPSYLLGMSIRDLFKGLAYYAGGYKEESFRYLAHGVSIFVLNEYLIGLGGPQFISIFHSVFKIAFKENINDLIHNILNCQRKQQEIFPSACSFTTADIELAQSKYKFSSVFSSSLTPTPPQEKITITTNPSPFHWPTEINIPTVEIKKCT